MKLSRSELYGLITPLLKNFPRHEITEWMYRRYKKTRFDLLSLEHLEDFYEFLKGKINVPQV